MKQQLKLLSNQVHKLKPIVLIGGKGLTEAVQAEIDLALNHHQLIKIRISSGDREYREQIIEQICTQQKALLIKKIGHIIAIYRKKEEE